MIVIETKTWQSISLIIHKMASSENHTQFELSNFSNNIFKASISHLF